MASLYYSGYTGARSVATGYPAFNGKITIGAGSTASGALGTAGETYYVRLVCDADCQIERGSSPTADGNSELLVSSAVEYFWLNGGDQVAVIEKQ